MVYEEAVAREEKGGVKDIVDDERDDDDNNTNTNDNCNNNSNTEGGLFALPE